MLHKGAAMNVPEMLVESHHTRERLLRGRVLECLADGVISVVPEAGGEAEVTCDCLQSPEGSVPRLTEGDLVLVWCPDDETGRGVVLGAIAHRASAPSGADTTPDELLIEAKHSLTLRVGAGSITIREDGKILIKGKDLVSHAQRVNRIKGGAVQIN